MKKELRNVDKFLNIDRTDQLFNVAIKKADSLNTNLYDNHSIRANKLALGFGNLHINTAKTKIQAIRLIGYKDNSAGLIRSVKRKIRSSRKK